MERILRDINAVGGVAGCFVCDRDGKVLASTSLELYDAAMLATAGGIMAQTLNGLGIITRKRKLGDIVLAFNQNSLIVKPLANGCLYILCRRSINLPLLNLTADVVAKKLADYLKAG